MKWQNLKGDQMTRDDAIGILKDERWYMSRYSEEYKEAYDMAIEALSDRMIDRAELFNKLAILKAPPEANAYKAEVYRIINEM